MTNTFTTTIARHPEPVAQIVRAPATSSQRQCPSCSAALRSGTRIVNASDAERRRLERDLHDGAQQRLIYLAIQLRQLGSRLSPDSDQARLLAEAQEQLTASLNELRELASGLHPAALNHSLAMALESLAARTPVPVTLTVQAPPYRDSAAEVATYYIVSEALTNVAKYAAATAATVAISHDRDQLVVEVADDGVGGADPADGSGLRGLADRVEAIGGRLNVSSTSSTGTTVRAVIPCRALAAYNDTVDVTVLPSAPGASSGDEAQTPNEAENPTPRPNRSIERHPVEQRLEHAIVWQ